MNWYILLLLFLLRKRKRVSKICMGPQVSFTLPTIMCDFMFGKNEGKLRGVCWWHHNILKWPWANAIKTRLATFNIQTRQRGRWNLFYLLFPLKIFVYKKGGTGTSSFDKHKEIAVPSFMTLEKSEGIHYGQFYTCYYIGRRNDPANPN